MKIHSRLVKIKLQLKKTGVLLALTFLVFFIQSFFVPSLNPNLSVLASPHCDSVPVLNKQILAFVETKMNHKVGMGECWDLAAEALNSVGANWDQEYKFGRQVDPAKECVFPGDIIQFDKIKIEYKENNTYYRENLPHHTAIIYEVIKQDHYTLAEQNTGKLGQKVGTSPLELKNIKSGKFKIYRPVK